MALLDNRIVQVALALFVAYLVLNMVNSPTREGLETEVAVDASGTKVSVNGQTVATVDASGASSGATQTPTASSPTGQATSSTGATLGSTSAVVNGGTPAFSSPPQGSVPPSPLTSAGEPLLSVAPADTGAPTADDAFAPQAVDYDEVFNRNDQLDFQDLIPGQPLPELYADLKAGDTTNYLTNAYQLGIVTDAGRSRIINDPRKVYAIEAANVSPWGNPTRVDIDTTRRSWADIE
jgi:hypothetical protein